MYRLDPQQIIIPHAAYAKSSADLLSYMYTSERFTPFADASTCQEPAGKPIQLDQGATAAFRRYQQTEVNRDRNEISEMAPPPAPCHRFDQTRERFLSRGLLTNITAQQAHQVL